MMNTCPYCGSTDVDWGFDSDGEPGRYIIENAICLEEDCGKQWDMHYKFEKWTPYDE